MFKRAYSNLRRAILTRAERDGTVSAKDIRNSVRSISGPNRGAVVTRAFRSLVSEGNLVPTEQSVRNPDTHHNVTVYRNVTTRRRSK